MSLYKEVVASYAGQNALNEDEPFFNNGTRYGKFVNYYLPGISDLKDETVIEEFNAKEEDIATGFSFLELPIALSILYEKNFREGFVIDDYPLEGVYMSARQDISEKVDAIIDAIDENFGNVDTCPKNIALFLYFSLLQENKPVVHEDLNKIHRIAKKMIHYVDSVQDMVNMEDMMKLDEMDESKLRLSESGNYYFLYLVGSFLLQYIKKSKDNPHYHIMEDEKLKQVPITIDILQKGVDVLSNADLLACMYKKMCDLQENNFIKLSSWGIKYALQYAKEEQLPRIVGVIPQSLRTLVVFKNKGKLDCIPCRKGYRRFYGRTYYGIANKKGQIKKDGKALAKTAIKVVSLGQAGNAKRKKRFVTDKDNTGRCVRRMDDLLEELGIDPQDVKNLPWYIQWVGTAEQAQRRIDRFKESQQEMYDNGDERYDIINYYVTLIQLNADYYLKKMLIVPEVPRTGQEEQGWIEWSMTKVFGEHWGKKMSDWLNAIGKFVKVTVLFAYKFVSFLLNQPLVTEFLLQYLESYFENICEYFGFEQTKQTLTRDKDGKEVLETTQGTDILRTTKEGMLERFFEEEGRWIKLGKTEQDATAKKRNDAYQKTFSNKAFGLFNAMSKTMQEGKWKDAMEGAAFSNNNLMTELIGTLELVPLIGPMIKKVGPEKIQGMISGYINQSGTKVLKKMVKRFNSLNQLKRMYELFMKYSSSIMFGCKGKSLLDGMVDDQIIYNLGKHYETAIFNAPYYALIVLCEESWRKGSRRQNPDRQAIIEELIETAYVAQKLSDTVKAEKNQLLVDDNIQRRIRRAKQMVEEYKRFTRKKDTTFLQTVEAKRDLDTFFSKYNLRDKEVDEVKLNLQPEEIKSFMQQHKKILAVAGAAIVVGVGIALCPPCTAAVASGASSVSAGVASASATLTSNVAAGYISGSAALSSTLSSIGSSSGMASLTAVLSQSNKGAIGEAIYAKTAQYGTSVMVAGARVIPQMAAGTINSGKRWWQDSQVYCLKDVLAVGVTQSLMFRSNLNKYIDRFERKLDLDFSKGNQENKYAMMIATVESKQSIAVPWVDSKDQYQQLNVEEVTSFFEKYGPMRNEL